MSDISSNLLICKLKNVIILILFYFFTDGLFPNITVHYGNQLRW